MPTARHIDFKPRYVKTTHFQILNWKGGSTPPSSFKLVFKRSPNSNSSSAQSSTSFSGTSFSRHFFSCSLVHIYMPNKHWVWSIWTSYVIYSFSRAELMKFCNFKDFLDAKKLPSNTKEGFFHHFSGRFCWLKIGSKRANGIQITD